MLAEEKMWRQHKKHLKLRPLRVLWSSVSVQCQDFRLISARAKLQINRALTSHRSDIRAQVHLWGKLNSYSEDKSSAVHSLWTAQYYNLRRDNLFIVRQLQRKWRNTIVWTEDSRKRNWINIMHFTVILILNTRCMEMLTNEIMSFPILTSSLTWACNVMLYFLLLWPSFQFNLLIPRCGFIQAETNT